MHRPLEHDDDLAAFFTWREPRRISKSLTVQYDKVLYLIEDSEISRKAIGKYIEVWHYPDGRKELRLNGVVLPYSTYDRLQEIDLGAIVDNKHLGRTLEFIKLVQDKRDNNRSQALPTGDGPSRRRRKPTENKSQRLAVNCFPGQAVVSRNGIILAAHIAAFQQSWRAQATADVHPDSKYKNPVVLPTIQAGSAEVFLHPAMAG